jgi:hypothetical protein
MSSLYRPSRPARVLNQPHGVRRGLRVEQLEDRCVPACVITQTGVAPNVILTITGDDLLNNIQITDDGAGNIALTCDGIISPPVVGVRDIVVNSNKGADAVFYTLTGDLQAAQTRNVIVDLGNGSDTFLAQAANNADVLGTASLSFNVRGRVGNDNIRFLLTQDFDINAGGVLEIVTDGNAGNDRIALTQLGQISGTFNLTMNGGVGNDRVGASISLDSNSAGTIDAAVNGQLDNDILTLLLVRGDAFTGTLTGEVNGSTGSNIAVVSDGVTVTGVVADNILRMP